MTRLASLLLLASLATGCIEKVEASPNSAVLEAAIQTALSQTMTNEVLVGTTATLVGGTLSTRRSIYIQNLNSLNPIFCASPSAAKAVLNKSTRLDPWQGIDLPLPSRIPVYCIASVAQTTGSGTTYWELP